MSPGRTKLTEWSGDGDLHLKEWWWVQGIVLVGLEVGVHAFGHLDARLSESGLSECVVGLHEGEHDLVAYSCLNAVWCVDEIGASSNCNLLLVSSRVLNVYLPSLPDEPSHSCPFR